METDVIEGFDHGGTIKVTFHDERPLVRLQGIGLHSFDLCDGIADQSLSAFLITVSQSALGNITLSWAAPTENSDGSPLTDLAGYKIYYGKSSGIYDHEIRVDNPGVTTHVVENLVPDTYFFAATSFNSAGVESTYSGEAVRSVN